MEPKLNIITLGVADLKAACNFYEKGLGWKPSSTSSEHIVFFQLGGIVLSLYPNEKLAEDALQNSFTHGFRGITLAQNVPAKEDVAKVLLHAERAGGTIVKEAQDVFWGGHSGYFADPDGHLWEVAYNPFFSMNDCGELVLP